MKTSNRIELDDVHWTIEALPMDESPEGHFALGSDEADNAACQRILEDLQHNDWAWCVVRIKGEWNGLMRTAVLSGCSYASRDDFINEGCYYNDMREEVRSDIESQAIFVSNAMN